MNISKKTLVVFICLVLNVELIFGQAPPPPPGLPIDGGLGFL